MKSPHLKSKVNETSHFLVSSVDSQSELMCHRRALCIFKTVPSQIKKSSKGPLRTAIF